MVLTLILVPNNGPSFFCRNNAGINTNKLKNVDFPPFA